ncbi:telomerase RNA component interacting RNase-like isoform X2 [Artemia franciscana]|uniref:Uncharacterized protein n=1 Tax=Artemia franciscana TaxID=6661 RepID=A0AA88LE01_ARTSF|nr:hypothetical protein QYM36_003558 [Artemia franciscana]
MSTMNSSAIKVPFKNDGSFLEMFKKMQEEQKKLMSDDPATEQKNDLKNKNEKKLVDKAGVATPPLPIPLGKLSPMERYLLEVKKYKEVTCKEENVGRPIIK